MGRHLKEQGWIPMSSGNGWRQFELREYANKGPGALVTEDGVPSPTLFAIGPVTRGTFWEIISVPDIREQAEQVAVNVLEAARLAGRRAA